jgi:hypothetical protein
MKTPIPKQKILVGHARTFDTYLTPSGRLYAYSGTEAKHFANKKYWGRLK